jgi:muramoyltetrapeptide carboxypeptidase
MTLPPRLREGSRVALVAPAGPMAPERVDIALQRCHDYGLQPVLGAAARGRHGAYLAASDEERLHDLQQAIDDPDIGAVWALRGGYGTMRLLAGLDLARLAASPKAYIGFSDNTAIHLAMHARGVVSFHGPHAGGDMTELAERELRRTLWDPAPAGVLGLPADRPAVTLAGGVAEGPLLGGNLSLLAAMCGTPAAPRAHGAILFVEEIGEEDYRMDRAWMQLLLARALDGVAGIAFGRFTDCGADVLVFQARQDEEQVGQAVEVDDDGRVDVLLASEFDDASFGAAADRASDVQRRAAGGPAGQDERAQLRQAGLGVIDPVLEFRDPCDGQGRKLRRRPALRHVRRQVRTNGEEVRLHGGQIGADARLRHGRVDPAEHRVQFVHRAVCLDARMRLRHAAAPEQAGVAAVAGTCVDALRHQVTAPSSSSSVPPVASSRARMPRGRVQLSGSCPMGRSASTGTPSGAASA